jgi:hypothetical protein
MNEPSYNRAVTNITLAIWEKNRRIELAEVELKKLEQDKESLLYTLEALKSCKGKKLDLDKTKLDIAEGEKYR